MNKETVEAGYPQPKFHKGQEVYFFDYDETRIVKGVIKELVAYEKDNLYNLEIQFDHSGEPALPAYDAPTLP